MRTAGQLVVDQLAALGADLAFGVPGESYLAVLDGLIGSPIRFITCRQEGGAGYAAGAHAKLTGRPGLLMVTRGPGATNAAVAVHTAQQDETPLVVLVGLIPSSVRGRDAFQEFDLGAMFGSMAKWTAVVDRADRAAEVVARAWTIAGAGRPGPVVIGLPEDVLEQLAPCELADPPAVVRTAVDAPTVAAVRSALERAERPIVIVGGSRWTDEAVALLPTAFPGVPLVAAFRRQDLVDHRLDGFAGSLGLGADPELVRRVADADLLLVIGDRLDDPTTVGFSLVGVSRPRMSLVHVHPDPGELGRVHRPELGILATPESFLRAMVSSPMEPVPAWELWRAAARTGYEAWSAGGSDQETIVRALRDLLADDAIVTHGAGNFTRPVQRAYSYRRPGRQLAPISGSMGYGLPAAVAAQLAHPERQVVCVAGDGELLMTAQELATAAHYGLGLTVLVINNGAYGTIRTHQERRYPGREIATSLTNPDFVRFGEAFGAVAARVTTTDAAIEALAAAVASPRLRLVELVVT